MVTEKKFLSQNGQEFVIVKGKRWYVEYYITHPMGVRERKRKYLNRIKDPAAREEMALRIIADCCNNTRQNSNNGDGPLSEALEKCKADLKPKSYSTYKTKVKIYRQWLNGRDALSISTDEANSFLRSLKTAGKHNTTVLAYKLTLQTLYDRMKVFNPFKESIKIKKRSTSLMYFTQDQVKSLKKYFMANDPETWLCIQLLYYCFIRPGEIRLLKIPDINLQEGWIRVRAEISKNGKTQKVSIPAPFKSYLSRYLKSRKNRRGLVISKDAYGKFPVSDKHINSHHSIGLTACRIVGEYAFYSWKHTGAVEAVKAGINLKDLQLQLRHHSLDQVNEYLKDLGVMDSNDLRVKFPKI